ncbi:hypothetical protein CBL_01153 [Carabus blaptoides fortunei]
MMSIFYIKCESKIGLLFTAALGLFASLWTNCIFVICMKKNMYLHLYEKDHVSYEYDLILKTIQYEYLLIVAISIVSLFWGMRRGITIYFLPWACLKVCECIVLFFGIALIFNEFEGLIPFAFLSFGLNIYTSLLNECKKKSIMASLSRNDMIALFSHIRYINLRDTVSAYLAITGGLLVSLWSHCVLIVICIQDSSYDVLRGQAYVERLIINCAQITYFVIVVAGIVGLFYASKHKDKMMVYPWMCTKLFETVVSLIGTVLLATGGRHRYTGLMSVSLICLLAGGYLSLCAWDTTKKLGGRAQASAEETVPMPTVADEKPPSYDQFTNQV